MNISVVNQYSYLTGHWSQQKIAFLTASLSWDTWMQKCGPKRTQLEMEMVLQSNQHKLFPDFTYEILKDSTPLGFIA
uniref:Patatin n=1 Tax=Rhizophora mucronata TaxID=61149 RepID=A0A2P2MT94_RHIMU